MKGSVICTADKVLQQHDGKCCNCLEAITSILTASSGTRQWYRAHFDPDRQAYVQHQCPTRPHVIRKAA